MSIQDTLRELDVAIEETLNSYEKLEDVEQCYDHTSTLGWRRLQESIAELGLRVMALSDARKRAKGLLTPS